MRNKETISVVICTYNGELFVREQIESIVQQTRSPDEIIIVDDGSSDNTTLILEEYSANHENISVFINPNNLGFVENFSRCLGLANGMILVLADQDDIWHPKKLEFIDQYFSSHPEKLAVFSDADLIDARSEAIAGTLWGAVGFEVKYLADSKDLFYQLLKKDYVTGATMALRSSMLNYSLPVPTLFVHDCWFAIVAASQGGLGAIPDKLIRYRLHSNQTIGVEGPDSGRLSVSLSRRSGSDYLTSVQKTRELYALLFKHGLLSDEIAGFLQQRIDFYEQRATLHTNPIVRLWQVTKLCFRRRYLNHASKPFWSVLSDLAGRVA